MSDSAPLTTPPLAPSVVAALSALGIGSVAALRQTGADTAFLLLKAGGLSATRSVFWQLAALCEGCTPAQLSPAQRQYWQQRLDKHPPAALFPPLPEMERLMSAALAEAQKAADAGEIPVGAVVVKDGEIIAAAHNRCIASRDVSRHAEIAALAAAGQILGNYRLAECDLYVSLEPCVMCAGAMMQARIRRLVYAADEPKTGARSLLNLFADKRLNSHTAVRGGILAGQARQMLQDFFRLRRQNGGSCSE